jgi:prepilin-type N-terminal cleavage/methylation domain-containing protein
MFYNYLHFSRSKRINLTNNKGFSLVEVLTVIAIAGILAAIAYPNLLRSRSNMKTRAVASDIFSSFRSARIEAVKRNTNVCLIFKTDGTYIGFLDDGSGGTATNAGNRIKDGTEATLFSKQVQPGTSIITALTAGFNPQGRPLGGILGSVTVQNDVNTNLRYRSALSIAGRVDLQVTQDGGTTWK